MVEEVAKSVELKEEKSDLSFVKTSIRRKRKSNETKQNIEMLKIKLKSSKKGKHQLPSDLHCNNLETLI